jgi:hypothetical protein
VVTVQFSPPAIGLIGHSGVLRRKAVGDERVL